MQLIPTYSHVTSLHKQQEALDKGATSLPAPFNSAKLACPITLYQRGGMKKELQQWSAILTQSAAIVASGQIRQSVLRIYE
jgi:hypothetical protein